MCDVRTSAVVRLLIQVNSPGSVCRPHRVISSPTQSTSVSLQQVIFLLVKSHGFLFAHSYMCPQHLHFCHSVISPLCGVPLPHEKLLNLTHRNPKLKLGNQAHVSAEQGSKRWARQDAGEGTGGKEAVLGPHATTSSVRCGVTASNFTCRRPFPWGFPSGRAVKESACQCRRCWRCGFYPWVRKIPWRTKWQPTRVFLPGESPWTEEPGRLQSMGSQSWLWLSDYARAHALSQVSFRNSLLILQLTYRGICCICVCSSETRNDLGAPLRGLVEKNHSGETHGAIRMCVATKCSLRCSIKSTNALRTGRGVCAAASV